MHDALGKHLPSAPLDTFVGRGRRTCKRQRQLKAHEQEMYGVPIPSVVSDSSQQSFKHSGGSDKNTVFSDVTQEEVTQSCLFTSANGNAVTHQHCDADMLENATNDAVPSIGVPPGDAIELAYKNSGTSLEESHMRSSLDTHVNTLGNQDHSQPMDPQCSTYNNISDGAHALSSNTLKETTNSARPLNQRKRRNISGGQGKRSRLRQRYSAADTNEDLGDCNERCRYCNAAFWAGEQLAGHRSHTSHPKYHLCCGDGKIFMEPENRMSHFEGSDDHALDPEIVQGLINFLDANNELVQLFRTARDKCADADVLNFKVRLYNAKGARNYELPTSQTLGAIVFDSGPTTEADYDRKRRNISGGQGKRSRLRQRYSPADTNEDASPVYQDLGDCNERCRYCNAAFWAGEQLAGHRSHTSSDDHDLDPEIVQGLINFLDANNELVQLFRTARDKCAGADVPNFKVRLYNAKGARNYELPTSQTLGAIVFDSGPTTKVDYDVIIEYRDAPPKKNQQTPSVIHVAAVSTYFHLWSARVSYKVDTTISRSKCENETGVKYIPVAPKAWSI
ncbi:DNA helicase PIF1, ATP-dependent [Artemisia annua]|uniref:DNA helicase PIF1, ATP-dependent n=1 Tax=Artemisia annua TaxID=35608 RepID=A0A2U1PBJ9_ARTAN|nr:DNA helicase PIF1, ATP-dependent [Artemisia annua]